MKIIALEYKKDSFIEKDRAFVQQFVIFKNHMDLIDTLENLNDFPTYKFSLYFKSKKNRKTTNRLLLFYTIIYHQK